MWPGFKLFGRQRVLPALVALVLWGAPVQAQQLVYDLHQDWVYYNNRHQGFLPIDENNLAHHAISFAVDDPEFDPFYLAIGVSHKAYLFHRSRLIATLPPGITSFKVDSLRQVLADPGLFLTIYGQRLLPGLTTEVRTAAVFQSKTPPYEPVRFANHFSNFFYLGGVVLALMFVVLKIIYPDLMHQYLLFQRGLRIKTIDELIYKISFLGFPNIFFLAFLSLVLGFVIMAVLYLFPGTLTVMAINPGGMGFGRLLVSWLQISGVLLLALAGKHLLALLVASAFDLKIANYHAASSLRLTFMLAFILLALVSVQFILVGHLAANIYGVTLLLAVITLWVILFFKLTLLTSHTLLYIFVYLCATEIIPLAILLKYITG